MAAEGISYREFGRRFNVTGEAVRKAIATGKIPADCLGEKTLSSGRKQPCIIDPERAAEHWLRNRDPNQVRDKDVLAAGARRGWAQRRGEAPPQDDEAGGDATPAPVNGAPISAGAKVPSIAESKAITEAYKARMAKLEYEEKAGKLVNADQVKARFIGMVTAAKTKLMGIPSKAKARIPTLTVADIEALEDLIAEALEELALGR